MLNVTTSNDIYDDWNVIACPLCGFEFNHVQKVETIPGNDNYEAGWGGRGDLIVVSMEGECGHKWDLCIGFHKGVQRLFARKTVKPKRKKVSTR